MERRDQPEYVAERFDIHVMEFADDSAATIAALAEIFSIDQGVAQRLVCDAPVVVKRAASPEVADRLLDALARLGAQVVILPTSGQRAPEPVMQEPERAPTSAPARAVATNGWGGFDFGGGAPLPAPVTGSAMGFGEIAPHAEPPRAAPPRALLDDDLFGGLASAGHAPAPTAPISLPPLLAPTSPVPDQELEHEAPLPALELDVPAAPAVESSVPPALRASELEVQAFVPPPLAVPRRAGPPAPPAPPVPSAARSVPHVRRAGAAMPPPPPFAAPPPPPPQAFAPRASDLGLGAVPPLPSLSGAPPLLSGLESRGRISSGPPLRPSASALPHVSERPRFEDRMREPSEPLHLPRIDAGTVAAARAAPAAEAAPQPASAAKTKAKPGAKAEKREPSTRFALENPERVEPIKPAEKKPESRPKAPPARGRALVQLLGSALVLYLGLYFDNTVLHGNASMVSIVLHGFAFYGIGSGLRGLWP